MAMAQAAMAQDDPEAGMIGWPQAEMRHALDYFIERRMRELDIPGVALAVIADGRIVYEKGYGYADADGDQDVTPSTLFEVGGLGLPLEAYAAMLQVRERKMSLDTPLSDYLKAPWLPDEEASATVTLRHVLNHRSGLSDRVRLGSRGLSFEPGTEFGYSGMGYVYLADVMSEIEGVPFDRLMRQRLFRPLGMSSSGYIIPEGLVGEVARGHHALWMPISAFAGPMAAIFAILAIATVLVLRLGFHRLKLEPFDLVPAAVIAPVGASAILYYLQGGWALLFCLGYFIVWLAAIALIVAAVQYLRFIFDRGWSDGVLSPGVRRSSFSPVLFVAVLLMSLFFMTWQVPLPARDGDDFNAALSLRSSAHDLALFVTGFVDGALVGPPLRATMIESRVTVAERKGDRFGWGLGFGTRERPDSLTIWQASGYIGTAGLMVIDPARRAGVVVLANADSGAELTQAIAGHALGPEEPWRLP
jgi:CubicO group peptidase (beta-lactamase class C family)